MTDLPAGWTLASLGELGQWIGGGTPSKRTIAFWNGDIPWVSPKDMKVFRVRDAIDHITTEAVARSSTNLVPPGAVLVVTRSGILRRTLPVAVTDREVAINQDLKALLPDAGLMPEYVAWFLRARASEIIDACSKSGTTVQSIETAQLLDFAIPIAPVAEQARIVAAIEEQLSRLEAAEGLLCSAMRRIGNLRLSVINSVVTDAWPLLLWKEVGRSQNGRAFPSRDYSDEGVRLLRPGNLDSSGHVVWTKENTRRLPAHYEQGFPSYVVGPNELVMNLTAQSLKDEFLGRICLTGPQEHCLLNQRLARLTPFDADRCYLLSVFKARPFRRFVNSLNKGSLIQHMFTSQIDEFEIPMPPLDEQRRLSAKIQRQLSVIDAMTADVSRAAHRCGALRNAILQQAFTGELVSQDPGGEPPSALLDRIGAPHESTKRSRRQSGTRS
jgi:type I restriction enzyme S subunit